jgi:hypothetical protein
MKRFLNIVATIFFVTLFILVASIFANLKFPNGIAESPYPGLKQMVALIEAIDVADYYATLISGFITTVTYIVYRVKRDWLS